MKKANKLICLCVSKPVAPSVLDKGKFTVDAFNNGCACRLRQDKTRKGLQLGGCSTILIPPMVSGHFSSSLHSCRAAKWTDLSTIQDELSIHSLGVVNDRAGICGWIFWVMLIPVMLYWAGIKHVLNIKKI